MIAAAPGLAVDGPFQPSHLALLAPAVGGMLAILFARRHGVATFALTALGGVASVIGAFWLLIQFGNGVQVTRPRTIGPLPLGESVAIPLQLHVDHIAVLLSITVTVVALTVQLFARWYLYNDPRYATFAISVAIFTSSMMLVVLSGDVILTIVGWELMGWWSYLLIGHESHRRAARAAAQKAYLVTRVADAPFIVGMAALAAVGGSTSWARLATAQFAAAHPTTVSAAMVCIIVGIIGKSAQFPLHDWLPDAMEGPTPASALIHAATMVAAGAVVLTQLSPLLAATQPGRWVLMVSAAVSAVGAAMIAFAQQDLKRLLAWSTVSQVAIMLIGLAAHTATRTGDDPILQLVGHASFKALLFLMFGWLAVLAGSTRAERMSGIVRRHHATRRLTAIGLLALAAVPPTVGFFAKDLVIDSAVRGARGGDAIAIVGAVAVGMTVFLTAAYAMRAWLLLSRRTISEYHDRIELVEDSYTVQDVPLVELLADAPLVDRTGQELEPGFEDHELVEAEAPSPTDSGRFGLWVLALASLFAGGLIFTPLLRVDWRHPDPFLTAAALLLMVAAALLVKALAVGTAYGDAAAKLPVWLRGKASRGMDFGDYYRRLVGDPVLRLADAVLGLDARLDDVVDGIGTAGGWTGRLIERLHRRRPADGLLAIAIGLVFVGVMGAALW